MALPRLFLLPVSCAALSVVASLTLQCLLSLVPKRHQSRLMTRQFWHLTLADLVFSLSFIVQCVLSSFRLWRMTDGFCYVSHIAISTGLLTSCLVETHLSLTLVLCLCRCSRAMCVLRKGLFIVWPAGVLLSTYATVSTGMVWQDGQCSRRRGDLIMGAVECVSGLISVTCLVASLIWVGFNSTVTVASQTRVCRRVSLFILAWFMCIAPETIRFVWFDSHADCEIATLSLLCLNGFANVLVYVFNGNYALRLVRRIRSIPIGERTLVYSFGVGFGGVEPLSRTSVLSDDPISISSEMRCDSAAIYPLEDAGRVSELDSVMAAID